MPHRVKNPESTIPAIQPEFLQARGGLPDALRQFDELPNSAYVRVQVVAGLESCSVATVWRRSRNGTLPAPIRLSEKITGWSVGQLRTARAQRVAA